MRIGSGYFTFEWNDEWAKIPDTESARTGWAHNGAVVTDAGNIVTHHMGDPRILIFDRDGNIVEEWDTGISNAHDVVLVKEGDTEYLWLAGLWIGAIKNAEPAVTTGLPVEYRPGLGELDRMYRTRDLAPGGARAPSPNEDDDRDGLVDEDWLDGRDNDGDGLIDEDFAGISTQMFFCEYRDTDPNIKLSNSEHEALCFLVQQSSLCWEDQLIDDFILFDYLLVNEGFDPLFDVFVGFWADASEPITLSSLHTYCFDANVALDRRNSNSRCSITRIKWCEPYVFRVKSFNSVSAIRL